MLARNVTRLLLLGLAAVITAGTLTSFSVLRDSSVTQANMPRPIQPFAAPAIGGVSTTQLGQSIAASQVVTQVLKGERATIPAVFSGPGFSVDPDASIPDGTNVGTVWSEIDVNCDGTVDHLYLVDPGAGIDCTDHLPLRWLEAGTFNPPAFLLAAMPPFPWILRHNAAINNVCIGDAQVGFPSVLNTVYSSIPFSPGGSAFVATTLLGGAPNTPPSPICLDSPQNSASVVDVYNNPPLKGDTGGPTGAGGRGLDDNSGLYVRWAALQSMGSTSLNQPGDLRKSFQSPPSFPSDTGYVERFVQLDCYWLDDNGCSLADCDRNHDGVISAEESWYDPDLLWMGGIDNVDADHDCLMNAGHVQPGWPAVDAVDTPTGVSCDSNPNWVPYSVEPVLVHHDTAADTDCDGLVDGIEWAWGSNPFLADSDADGAPDFVEMFQSTNPLNPDTDGDGFADKPAPTYQNSKPAYDNCPTVYNPDQLNSDGKGRPNGPQILGDYASNPNQDKLGDACDPDDDNDGATDVYELGQGTDPLKLDTDGDTVNDGAELRIQIYDPLNASATDPARFPTWNANEQVYYRGCRINVNNTYPGFWEYDGTSDGVEMDVDGDGILCQSGGSIVDEDSDNGTGTGSPAQPEIIDSVEAFGYNLQVANKDTDGDGCPDWIEIVDVDGDRWASSFFDVDIIADGVFSPVPFSPDSDYILDIDKNGLVTVVDVMLALKNSSPQRLGYTCPPGGG